MPPCRRAGIPTPRAPRGGDAILPRTSRSARPPNNAVLAGAEARLATDARRSCARASRRARATPRRLMQPGDGPRPSRDPPAPARRAPPPRPVTCSLPLCRGSGPISGELRSARCRNRPRNPRAAAAVPRDDTTTEAEAVRPRVATPDQKGRRGGHQAVGDLSLPAEIVMGRAMDVDMEAVDDRALGRAARTTTTTISTPLPWTWTRIWSGAPRRPSPRSVARRPRPATTSSTPTR